MHKPHSFRVWVLFGSESKPLEAYLKFPKLLVLAKLQPSFESLSWDFFPLFLALAEPVIVVISAQMQIYQYNMSTFPKANWHTDYSPGELEAAQNWAKQACDMFKISASRSLFEAETFSPKKPLDV